jgi:hypothetical protein
VKTELDLVDCSEWIMVKRNSALYELHNGDVDILKNLEMNIQEANNIKNLYKGILTSKK